MNGSDRVLIESYEVSKHFNGIVALNNVSLTLEKGERVGIIGVNGSGKTTLINVLSRLHDIDAGDILLRGKSYKTIKPYLLYKNGMTRSFQHTRNWNYMNIIENMMITGGEYWRENYLHILRRRKRIREIEKKIWFRACELLEYFEMNDLIFDYSENNIPLVGELSIGQQRIIELIRVFLAEPDILFFDEPSTGLNPRVTQLLSDKFSSLVSIHK